jgi:hypothetical protein
MEAQVRELGRWVFKPQFRGPQRPDEDEIDFVSSL